MARFSGRKVAVGIGLENPRGTNATAGYWYPQMEVSARDADTPIYDESSYGTIVKTSGKDTVLVEGDISLSGNIYIKGIYYFLALVFGQLPTTTLDVGGDTGANKYAYDLKEDNEHLSATVTLKEPNQDLQFPFAMPESFTLNWTPGGYPTIEIPIKSAKSEAGSSTKAYILDTKFLPKHASLKIAANLAGLTAATALTDIKSFSITFTKALKPEQTMDSGDTYSYIFNTDFEVSGSIEKLYNDTTYKGYALNDTVKAMRFALTDSINKAGTTTATSLTFDLSRATFSAHEPAYGRSDISTEKLDFVMALDLSDFTDTVSATLINKYTYA